MSKDKTPSQPVPQLRFPEFREDPGWTVGTAADAIDTITPPKKLQTSQYDDVGLYPVIDQSPDALCGWTNDREAVIEEPLPVIIFGDHTCVLKITNRPFVQGADGIKIINGRNGYETEFLFYILSSRPLKTESYKRHFTQLKTVEVAMPPTLAEQQKIAECLGSLDDWIAAETDALAALRRHKTGLMQQLFPRPGETRPRLRFPEFRDAGDWQDSKLGGLAEIVRGGSPRPIDKFLTRDTDGLNWLKIGDLDTGAKYVTGTEDRVIPDALSKTRVIEPGDLILSNSMSFGRPYLSQITTCIHDGWIAVRKIKKWVRSEFLYYAIMAPGTQAFFEDWAAGGGIRNLNIDIVKSAPMLHPEPDEQDRIAGCLASLDNLLAAKAEKLAILEGHKRGLMQQLFPAPDAAKGGG